MKSTSKDFSLNKQFGFYAILITLSLASLYIVRNYIAIIVLALIFAIVFDPLYQKIHTRISNKHIASVFTTSLVVLMVIVPIIITVTLAVDQARSIISEIDAQFRMQNSQLNQIIDLAETSINNTSSNFQEYIPINPDQVNLSTLIRSGAGTVSSFLTRSIVPIITGIFSLVVQLVLFIVFMVYFFPIRPQLMKFARQISPVESDIHHKFIKKFEGVTKGTLKSTFLIGFVQGLLGAIMLSILGFQDSAIFLGFLMGLASFIPGGAALVWVPISLIILLLGQPITALVYFIWGIAVISTSDNIIRMKVLKHGDAGLPEILTLISVLGGMQTFGFWGFIYGPIILALTFTALQVYKEARVKSA